MDVLEMGCGTGKNAICLAACGARVFAYDISGAAIEVARRKAELNHVADRVEFAVEQGE